MILPSKNIMLFEGIHVVSSKNKVLFQITSYFLQKQQILNCSFSYSLIVHLNAATWPVDWYR